MNICDWSASLSIGSSVMLDWMEAPTGDFLQIKLMMTSGKRNSRVAQRCVLVRRWSASWWSVFTWYKKIKNCEFCGLREKWFVALRLDHSHLLAFFFNLLIGIDRMVRQKEKNEQHNYSAWQNNCRINIFLVMKESPRTRCWRFRSAS